MFASTLDVPNVNIGIMKRITILIRHLTHSPKVLGGGDSPVALRSLFRPREPRDFIVLRRFSWSRSASSGLP